MDLTLESIEYVNFRNYKQFSLHNLGKTTLFIGPNAIGKTNLIEGIQLITALQSFRNPKNEYLVYNQQQPTFIDAYISNNKRQLEIQLRINENKKEYFLNKKKKQPKTLRGLLPSVLFCPDDLLFIKGSQSIKRNQIDALGVQLSANYYSVKKDYEKILKQKNKLLKETASSGYLGSINEVLCKIGAQFSNLRNKLLNELTPYIQQFYYELSNRKEKISVSYLPSWLRFSINKEFTEVFTDITQGIKALTWAINRYQQKEYERRSSLVGPHADTIEFFIDNKNARLFASQGQQRSLVLAFKMAEVCLLKDKLNQNPVLLLDDVMSELDKQRREQLVSLFSNDIQTFITSTNLEYFNKEFLNQTRVIHLGDMHE